MHFSAISMDIIRYDTHRGFLTFLGEPFGLGASETKCILEQAPCVTSWLLGRGIMFVHFTTTSLVSNAISLIFSSLLRKFRSTEYWRLRQRDSLTKVALSSRMCRTTGIRFKQNQSIINLWQRQYWELLYAIRDFQSKSFVAITKWVTRFLRQFIWTTKR